MRQVAHRLVVGYHGCDRGLVERVLLHGEPVKASQNPWDWLGSGVYFWEHSPRRALEWASQRVADGKFTEAAVLGAYIDLGRCFDLTDTDATAQLSLFYEDYVSTMTDLGRPLAANRGGPDRLRRDLDCAVLNLGLGNLDAEFGNGRPYYETVRGVFVEGDQACPGAGIHVRTHVQVAVRDPGRILGYFSPAGYDEVEEGP